LFRITLGGNDQHGNDQDKTGNHHAGVGNIKGRPPFHSQYTIKFYADKIHHSGGTKDAVYDITQTSAYDTCHCPALEAGKFFGSPVIRAKQAKHYQRKNYEKRGPQEGGNVTPQAEGDCGVSYMVNLKKFIAENILYQAIPGPAADYVPLGYLIREDNKNGQQKGKDLMCRLHLFS
jgi:hypothetical protein